MPDIYQLEYLISIAEHGTFSKAAKELHLSQSALSRSMQKLESELRVTLFERKKNKVELNRNGELAVECAKKVISQMQDMTEKVRIFDRNSRTISVGSCAPAPLLDIIPTLSNAYPDMAISSEMQEQDKLLQGLKDGIYHLIITSFPAFQRKKPNYPLSSAGLKMADMLNVLALIRGYCMKYEENVLSYENYHKLRTSVGWTNFSPAQAQTALANSLYTVTAVEKDETVAMGRLIGDGQYYMIVDVIVRPDFQKRV